jgi:hypothetical protein
VGPAALTLPPPRLSDQHYYLVTGTRVFNSSNQLITTFSLEACDTQLGPPPSQSKPRVCYSALQRLPSGDSHPLESNRRTAALARCRGHDAT